MAAPTVVNSAYYPWAGAYPLASSNTFDSTGSDGAIVFFFCATGAGSFSATPVCTYLGQTGTLIGSSTVPAQTSAGTLWAWIVRGFTPGSGTLSIAQSTSYADIGCAYIVALSGTQSTPLGASQVLLSSTPSATASAVLTASGSLVLSFAGDCQAPSLSASGSPALGTAILSNTTATSNRGNVYATSSASSGATASVTATAPYNYTSAAVIEVLGASGGPSPQSVTAAPVTASFTLGAVTVVTPKIITAAPVSATFTLGAVTVLAPQAITAAPVTATFSLGAVTVLAPQAITAAPLTGSFTLGAMTVLVPKTVTAAPVTATFTLGAVSVLVPKTITAAPVTATFTLGAVSLFSGKSVTAAPLTGSFTLGAVTVSTPQSIFTTGVSATYTLGAVTVSGVANPVILADPLTGIFTLDAVTVTLTGPQSITADPVVATFTVGADIITEANFLVYPLTIPPGGTATFTLEFNPTATGPRTGILSFASNAAAVPVTLTGTGTAPVTPPPAGRFSTSGAHIVDSAGTTTVFHGVNWHGAEGSNHVPHSLWLRSYASVIDQIAALGFNLIRIPLSADITGSTTPAGIDLASNPDLTGLTALGVLDKIINYAGTKGVYVFLDCHRLTSGAGTDSAISGVSLAAITTFWQLMATRYAANLTVIGADLYNEPYTVTDWSTLAGYYTALGNAIHAIAPDWLIICEGNGSFGGVSYWWGGQLAGAAATPVTLTHPNKLVYSSHDYGLSVGAQAWLKSNSNLAVSGWPNNLDAIWDAAWGYLVKTNVAPVIVGEYGGLLGYDAAGAVDATQVNAAYEQQWFSHLITYMKTNGISSTYWTFTSESGDTGGLLRSDDLTLQSGKITLLAPLLA